MSSVRRVVLCAVAIVVALATAGHASVINVPRDQPTVQAGIRAAESGDTVLVAPGTYVENLDFLGKAITVTSLGGEAVTILDGGSRAPVVTFKSGETRSSVLSHFTIRNGGPNEVTSTTIGRGGVNVVNSQPSLLNNIVTQNNCWGIVTGAAAPLIQGNEISQTLSPDGGCGFGGGAAIYVGGDLQPNTAGSAGARTTPAQILGNVIENNTRSGLSDAGGNGGAGIAVWGGSPMIANNTIRNNASPGGSGGAINIEGGAGAAIVQNLIYGNSASCGGGAIAFEEGGIGPVVAVLIANNTIVNNTSTAGAGYSNCTRASQIYPFPGTYGLSGPQAIIVNNVISGSDAGPAVTCAQDGRQDEAQQPLFDHNLLYNAGGAFFSTLCADVSAKYGNVSGDPQFVDAAHGNFHVQRGSPATDAGNNSALQVLQNLKGVGLSQDFDGLARVADSTGKGYPVIDMGAYELPGAVDATPTTLVLESSTYVGAADSNNTLIATARSALGVPGGVVTFYLDGRQIGVATLAGDGTATLQTVQFSPGTHALLATYAGQGGFPPATSLAVIIRIQPYVTTILVTGSPNPSLVGQSVTFTVTSSSGDPNFVPSPIAVRLDRRDAPIATLTPDASGRATYTTSTLSLGGHQIEADFTGDSVHAPGGFLVLQNVVNGYATTTQIRSSLNPANITQAIAFTAAVSSGNGSPAGTVSFLDGATMLATQPISGGMASFTTSSLSAGTHAIEAVYNANGTFASSIAGVSEVVHGVATATSLRASPVSAYAGAAITLAAQALADGVAIPGSNGTVSFLDGGVVLGGGAMPVGAGGTATATLTTLAAGTHTITAMFSGDATHDPSTSAPVMVTVLANPTALALSSSSESAAAFQAFQLSARLSSSTTMAHATGGILFSANGVVLGQAPLSASGVATLPVSLAAGSYVFSAAFAGDAVFGASNAAGLSEQIVRDASVSALAVSPNPALQTQTVTLVARVTAALSAAVPTGMVSLLDGAVTLASVPVDGAGRATFTSSTLAVGSHSLLAVYTGSANHLPSSSPPVSLVVAPQDFSLRADPTITLRAEYHGDLKLTLASIGGFADTVDLRCDGLPAFASCTFANGAPVLAGGASVSAVVHVDTDALLNYRSEARRPGEVAGVTLALLVPVGLLLGWRRPGVRLVTVMLAVGLGAGATLLSGCSGKIPSHAATGTYDITLAARGRNTAVAHTVHFQLVITQ